MLTNPGDSEVRLISEAVRSWFCFYEVDEDDRALQTLCTAALDLYGEGYRTADALATMLIGTYVGIWSTRINAPGSNSVH
jgi:hypothetical protein